MNPQHTTGNVITAGMLATAIVGIMQLCIELAIPDQLWAVVQTKTQYWGALQTVINWLLLRYCPRCFSTAPNP